MGKKVLFVLAPKDFRDEEYLKPKEILEQAGVQIEVASRGVGEASGVFGAKAKVDKDLSQVSAEDYDGVIFIGGPGSSVYFNDESAFQLAKTAYEKGKIVGAICIAPSILANAGILSGKKATAFSSEEGNLKAKGAIFTGDEVTLDGWIITASGPQAAGEFAQEIKKALGLAN
jgi:protease I